ncbi:fas apoptotic inhibitory molecule 1-like [Gigantopelta aegis]|uniref:fas apoptotic inhibitory molecule 1-like n=1 Tax=Gigantopelta aegis TaxID=1735272 RepID=UPI001B88D118|nr:fas apoptotic inhibitory molecule 1-like [Gigantopelta aegis]XP_041371701.1 fas apoptotic inhibitory molecule 1-like [Gigantopelta aegis]
MSNFVASWEIPSSDGVHMVQFEHGTTSGKRVICVDGKEIYKVDWMFKLVGDEYFTVGSAKCQLIINSRMPFIYEYSLKVNGKSLKKFREQQSKILKSWTTNLNGTNVRIILEKNTLDVWVNGKVIKTENEFSEDGSKTHFQILSHDACIKTTSSGKRKVGLFQKLYIDNNEIPEATE